MFLIGIEDIILDRMSATKHWQDEESKDWATYLMAAYYDQLDWEYIERKVLEKLLEGMYDQIKADAYIIKEKAK